MSRSKSFCTPENVDAVMKAYLSEERPTLEVLAERFKTCYQTIQYIVRSGLSPERYKAEKALRYSRSKMGEKAFLYGNTGPQHPYWKGDCSDGKGYLTQVFGGERYFTHRLVMAEMVGIHPSELPESLVIHHIDGDKTNNTPDNLALVTASGHKTLHAKRSELQKSPLWVQWMSGTSKSEETTPTLPTG